MAKLITIKKGLDIHLEGAASDFIANDTSTQIFGIAPDDYPGYTWKVAVRVGDK